MFELPVAIDNRYYVKHTTGIHTIKLLLADPQPASEWAKAVWPHPHEIRNFRGNLEILTEILKSLLKSLNLS